MRGGFVHIFHIPFLTSNTASELKAYTFYNYFFISEVARAPVM